MEGSVNTAIRNKKFFNTLHGVFITKKWICVNTRILVISSILFSGDRFLIDSIPFHQIEFQLN